MMDSFFRDVFSDRELFIAFASMLGTLVSAIIALMALGVSVHQTKLSNQHQLFDRRLNKCVLIQELCILFKASIEQSRLREYRDLDIESMELLLFGLTNSANNGTLQIARLDKKYLNYQYQDDEEFQCYCEEKYIKAGAEIEVIWCNTNGKLVAEFVIEYGNLLFSLVRLKERLFEIQSDYDTDEALPDIEIEFQESDECKDTIQRLKRITELYKQMAKSDSIIKIKKSLRLGK